MVEFVGAETPAQFSITARPNFVRGKPGLRLAMFVLLPWSIVMGMIFLTLGVWPVTLFLALPVTGILWAFLHLERHAGDYERLVLDADRLILESHTLEEDRRLEFNSHWVQVALHPAAGGNRLTVRSHGKEFPFGLLLSDEERATVSREVNQRLARIRR